MIPSNVFYSNNKKLPLVVKNKLLWMSASSNVHELHQIISQGGSLLKNVKIINTDERWSIFSIEKDASGKRGFFTASHRALFEYLVYIWSLIGTLKDFESPIMHYYEVIPEGKPCNLYFDVEFLFKDHPEYNGDDMVEELIQKVIGVLQKLYNQNDITVIHLEGSSLEKFSRHLVFKCPTICFADSIQVGYFVSKHILSIPVIGSIIDPAVYSKNRCFRCIWSTKKCKGKNHFYPIDGKNSCPLTSSLEFFESTLIAFVLPEQKPVIIDEVPIKSKNVTHCSTIPHRSDLRFKLIESFCLASFAPTGYITKALFNNHFNTLLLSIDGCRFCRNIGREHKSNKIFIVCKLSHGVAVQKCFDPNCKGFESDPVTIPESILNDTLEICSGKKHYQFLSSDSDEDFIFTESDHFTNASKKNEY